MTMVLSLMPVWFLKPSQLPALVAPVAALAPVPWVPDPPPLPPVI